jgi:hypothetical protein
MSDIHADQFRDLAASPITGRHFTGRPGWALPGGLTARRVWGGDVPAGDLDERAGRSGRPSAVPAGTADRVGAESIPPIGARQYVAGTD